MRNTAIRKLVRFLLRRISLKSNLLLLGPLTFVPLVKTVDFHILNILRQIKIGSALLNPPFEYRAFSSKVPLEHSSISVDTWSTCTEEADTINSPLSPSSNTIIDEQAPHINFCLLSPNKTRLLGILSTSKQLLHPIKGAPPATGLLWPATNFLGWRLGCDDDKGGVEHTASGARKKARGEFRACMDTNCT
ncbi:leucine-rich repeat protein kinase family protein [Striga asiatica]|uniref:Leucine-rich repeat protein kinase family protein n=1 Tax=Striga asiatica TaxID=4170 RepID=A0A5A7PCK4_STRAF|nr:leucine-rich repeat protein kinase family protein [Striga asiatica]